MHLGAGNVGGAEADADFDAFDGLNRHQRLRQFAVNARVPLRIGAEADGQAQRDHFKRAAERVAPVLGLVNGGDDLRFGVFVGDTDGAVFGQVRRRGAGQCFRR